MRTRRRFTPEFKARVVLELLSGIKTSAEASREYQIKPDMLSRWKTEFLEKAPSVFRSGDDQSAEQARIAELERMIGKLTLELEVSKKALSFLNGRQDRSEVWR